MQFLRMMRRSSFFSQLRGFGRKPFSVMSPFQQQPANLALSQAILQGEPFDFLGGGLERDFASLLHVAVVIVAHRLRP